MIEFLSSLAEHDYALTRTNPRMVSRRSLVLAVGFGSAVLLLLLAVHLMILRLGGPGVFLLTCTAAAAGFVTPIRRVKSRADRSRAQFDMAVAVLLDLVNIQTAGGAGMETSLVTAASIGDGWCFDEFRSALSRAHASRSSYWDGLHEIGRTYGISSLVEAAQSVRMAGEHGARVRQSLVTKAASLRARNLARIEHQAHQRTEQMGLPMVVLFLSFLVFIGYPALAQTMGVL